MKTDFDTSLEKINIIPEDIGRIMLNLFSNAFYVVDRKKELGISDFEPTVSISTKKIGDKVGIIVAGNSNGIPQKILNKIFQPFFIKPTGQGNSLGLSLSYDIIKAHVGEIKVVSKVGEGTTFIIQLPI
jgi:signal transduction histidine kinase